MNKKMSKRQRDLKTKLMAAICMLLVSSIMMVSTTYAWFTLSTAPEVTGITTAVGANGNLEMALMPADGDTSKITSSAGDSKLTAPLKNVTWGNLVDLSDDSYGLDKIQLYPSALNVEPGVAGAKDSLKEFMLQTPAYGADGRVSDLLENTFTGIYEEGSFAPSGKLGVRAVGTASGMTDRQLSYRNASAAANTAAAKAAQLASKSLTSNGGALADVAIKKGTGSNEFTQTDVNALYAIIDDLQKTDGVLSQIEKAYMQYILAFAASKENTAGDAAWSAVKNLVEADGATLKSVIDGLAGVGVNLPSEITGFIDHYNDFDSSDVDSMVDKVADAKDKLDDLGTKETYTWTELSPALNALANPDAMLVNGIKAGEIMKDDNMNALVSSVTGGQGLAVTMATGGGIYADIADQSGNYTANVKIQKIKYGTLEVGPLDAKMNTATSVDVPYLTAAGAAVVRAGAPESAEGDGAVPITDMFGYIIDMAFRTNAADSNLLLQVDAADRIYKSNQNGVEQKGEDGETTTTMGGGATMTFTSTTNSFGNDKVLKLMEAIRIVFFDTDTKEIVANAKLNTAEGAYETTADGGIKAFMQLYTMGSSTTEQTISKTDLVDGISYTIYYRDADMATEYCRMYTDDAGEHWGTYADGTFTENADLKNSIPKVTITGNATEIPASSNELMPLTQNTPHKLSVLVYLDGNKVTNADVAATATTSVTGTMNLQFASSANLTPMDYTPLKEAGGGSGSGTEEEATTYTVTIDGTASTAATANTAYTFTLDTGKSVASIKVGGTDLTADTDYTVSGQSVTIKAEKVTGAIVVTTA